MENAKKEIRTVDNPSKYELFVDETPHPEDEDGGSINLGYGVNFPYNEALALAKNDTNLNGESFIKNFLEQDALISLYRNDELIINDWEMIKPMEASEAFLKYRNNEGKLMTAFKFIGPEKIFQQLGGELIDEFKITKTQKKLVAKNPEADKLLDRRSNAPISRDDWEEVERTYEDTYRLYKITQEKLIECGLESIRKDMYLVQCQCPSTNEKYYIEVPSDESQCQTAQGAIAFTFEKEDGKRMTPEEWEEMAYKGQET